MENELILNPQSLIDKAIEKGVDVATMERLLAMFERVQKIQARNAFYNSLAEFQKECPIIEKRKRVYSKDNKLRYRYAPLDQIIEQTKHLLHKYGFSYVIKTKQESNSVTAICIANHIAGHSKKTPVTMPIDPEAYMNACQRIGSALTYATRRAFCNAFGIITGDEDYDANGTGEQAIRQKKNPVKEKSEPEKQISIPLPEENENMYRTMMRLINEKEKNKDLFTIQEKIENKKKADAVKTDIAQLKEFYQSINQLTQERRKKIREGIC